MGASASPRVTGVSLNFFKNFLNLLSWFSYMATVRLSCRLSSPFPDHALNFLVSININILVVLIFRPFNIVLAFPFIISVTILVLIFHLNILVIKYKNLSSFPRLHPILVVDAPKNPLRLALKFHLKFYRKNLWSFRSSAELPLQAFQMKSEKKFSLTGNGLGGNALRP